MRRLALLPILYLSACCSPAKLKQPPLVPATTGGSGLDSSGSGGETSGGGSSGGSQGTSTGGLEIPDSGPYDADAGKPASCQPISFPTPCTATSDCSGSYVCVAHGCQPAACGQCGTEGQQACPFPLVCQEGACVATPPGSTGASAGNGSAGNGSAGNGSAGNSGSAGNGSAGNGSASNGSAGNGSAGNGSASNGSAGNGSAGNSSSAGNGSAGNGSASNGSAGNGSAGNSGSAGNGSAGNGASGSAGNGGATNGAGNGSAGNGAGGNSTGGHQPDGGLCKQDPNLQGSWNMTQQYEMAQALATAIGGVVQAVNDIDQLMQLLQALGAPIPSWVTTLMGDLLNLQYLLSQIDVNGGLILVNGANSMTYTATENWQNITLVPPNGMSVSLAPNKDGGGADFYFTSPPPYTVTTCSGIATFDQHDLEGALSGIIPPLLDAITKLATCPDNGPCYQTFQQAIAAAIDCAQFTPPSGLDAGPPVNPLGNTCSEDSSCNNCYLAQDLVCKSGKCKYGCENSYDCGQGFFCDAHFDGGPDCNHATVLTTSSTTVSGSVGSSCAVEGDCNGNQPGSGTFCLYPEDDAGIPIPNDAGQYIGTCTAGCNGSDNFACANTDVCEDNPTAPGSYTCLTVDTSTQTVDTAQDTGCNGPDQPPEIDAGYSAATDLCLTVSGALTQELTSFLSQITFNFGVADVAGVCTVQDATDLTNGVWTGDVVFVPITGTFSAQETSKAIDGG